MKDSVDGVDYRFKDPRLLQEALTHRSAGSQNNERLEFLGDAVADFIAARYLYDRFPQWQEGELTGTRAELVRSDTLARFAAEIDLGNSLLLGRGEVSVALQVAVHRISKGARGKIEAAGGQVEILEL